MTLPSSQASTSFNANAPTMPNMLDKPLGQLQQGAKNMGGQPTQENGNTQAYHNTRNCARNQLSGQNLRSLRRCITKTKNYLHTTSKSVNHLRLELVDVAQAEASTKTMAPTSRPKCGTRSSITWTTDRSGKGGANPLWVSNLLVI